MKETINVNIGQISDNITKDIDLVVYTAAVKADNPELVKARELGIPTVEERAIICLLIFEISISSLNSLTFSKI